MREFFGVISKRERVLQTLLLWSVVSLVFVGSVEQNVVAQSTDKAGKEVSKEAEGKDKLPSVDFKLFKKTKVKEWSNPIPEYPADLKKLNQKRVKMRGFMAPYDSLDNMSNFMLMTGATGCFFCTPPSMTEALLIRQKPKKDLPYLSGAIEVEGKLKLWSGDKVEEDYIAFEGFFYIIEDAEVKQVQLAPGEQSPVGPEHGLK